MKQGETLKKLWDRWKYAALVALAGAALLLLPLGAGEKAAPPEEDEWAARTETENRMETLLSKIDGAGALQLMLTADGGTQKRLAENVELSYSGDPAAPGDYQRRSETVLSGGEETPVVTGTRYPLWRGAVVVCQGGGDAKVRLAVTEAVAALTGLGADRIAVIKCQ